MNEEIQLNEKRVLKVFNIINYKTIENINWNNFEIPSQHLIMTEIRSINDIKNCHGCGKE